MSKPIIAPHRNSQMTNDRTDSLRTALIVASVHHGNTRRIAEAMSSAIDAPLFNVEDRGRLDENS